MFVRPFFSRMKTTFPADVPALKLEREPVLTAILDWIDRELGEVYGRRCGKGGDTLLELRRVFVDDRLSRLLPRLLSLLPCVEKNHYLLSFRIRTLLSSQFRARVSDPLDRTPAVHWPLPTTTRALRALRSNFFEHSEVVIPLHDIRIEFVPGIGHS